MGATINIIMSAVIGPGEDEGLAVLTAEIATGEGSCLSTERAVLFKFLFHSVCIIHPGCVTLDAIGCK